MKLKLCFRIVTLVLSLMIVVFSIYGCTASTSNTYLQDKQYESINELHNDLVIETQKQATDSDDFLPTELVDFCQIEDKYFVFSKYASDKGGDEIKDCLYVYVVKKVDGKFVLETPKDGMGKFAEIKLIDYPNELNWWYYATCELNGTQKSICFLYKSHNEQRKLTFDNVTTTEIEMLNPFNGEKFYLCYAVSNADTFSDRLKPLNERHNVELA